MHKVQTFFARAPSSQITSQSVANHITFFKICQWSDTVNLSFISHTDKKVYSCTGSLSPIYKPMCDMLHKWNNWKIEQATKMKVQQINKNDNNGSKMVRSDPGFLKWNKI